MELKYLSTFQTVVEEGGFSKAAEKLHYTQSTITFQMDQLEKALSATLFERVGRRMALTKAGEQLVPYVANVLTSVEQLRFFESDLLECQGELRIGVGESLLCYKLPPILKAFHEKAPKARLFLRSMNCYEIRNALLSGTLDLGVFYEDVGGFGTQLTTYPFASYSMALVASPALMRECGDFITPDRHIPVPLVINEPDCVYRQAFEAYLRERSIRLDHTIELWSIPTILNLVMNDVGVTYLPRFAVEDALSTGMLAEIETGIQHPRISAICGHHKNKWVSPLMRQFIDLCFPDALRYNKDNSSV